MHTSRLLKLLVAGMVLSAPAITYAADRFQGPFAGIYFGYVDGEDDGVEYGAVTGLPNGYAQQASPAGGALGAMGGYDWRFGSNFVLGVEADYEVRGAAEDDVTQTFNGSPTIFAVGTTLEDAGSIRVKLGYEFNGGKTLAYVTGGYAAAKIERYYVSNLRDSSWQDGWTAGLGVEHFISDKFSVKADVRYADYGTEVLYVPNWDTNEHQKYDETSVRFGMMYHF